MFFNRFQCTTGQQHYISRKTSKRHCRITNETLHHRLVISTLTEARGFCRKSHYDPRSVLGPTYKTWLAPTVYSLSVYFDFAFTTRPEIRHRIPITLACDSLWQLTFTISIRIHNAVVTNNHLRSAQGYTFSQIPHIATYFIHNPVPIPQFTETFSYSQSQACVQLPSLNLRCAAGSNYKWLH